MMKFPGSIYYLVVNAYNIDSTPLDVLHVVNLQKSRLSCLSMAPSPMQRGVNVMKR